MQCEVCEKYMVEGKRVRIEGSVVVTCDDCARYGEVVGPAVSAEKKKPAAQKSAERPSASFEVEGEGLIDNYAAVIKNKRERLGLKQEDLAKAINEPASMIHRLEIGKFEPSPQIVKKIEQTLRVHLMGKGDADGMLPLASKDAGELTLGDMVVIKKKEKKG